jgi:hypothetical protein
MWPIILPAIISLVDKLIPDAKQASEAKIKLYEMERAGELAALQGAVSIIVAEAQGNWLQRSWRPVMMLTFTGLIVARWLGWTAPGLTAEEYSQLWNIIQLGIGGYVIGRSGEKMVESYAKSKKGE